MFLNRVVIEAVSGFTAFDNGNYWSSTENDNFNAWLQYFVDGGQGSFNKGFTNSVRAVRAF